MAANMFARWSQENFFKYMRENFGIDRLLEYALAPIDETQKVTNPQYSILEKEIRSVTQKLFRKTAEFGSITLLKNNEAEQEEQEIEKYVIKKAEVSEAIEIYKKNLEELKIKRKGDIVNSCV